MWLPKDERNLLAGYFIQIGADEEKTYRYSKLFPLLDGSGTIGRIPEYGDLEDEPAGWTENEEPHKQVSDHLNRERRIEIANKHLAERGLIKKTQHESERSVVTVELTLKGYDLGRKYAHWFERSGLWWTAFRDHWILLTIVYLLGILSTEIVRAIISWFNSNSPGPSP